MFKLRRGIKIRIWTVLTSSHKRAIEAPRIKVKIEVISTTVDPALRLVPSAPIVLALLPSILERKT
jgi:hypothetical protein